MASRTRLVLVHPSANRVYGATAPDLAVAEVRAVAALVGAHDLEIARLDLGGVPYVRVLGGDEATVALLSNLAATLALFEIVDGASPASQAVPYLRPLSPARLDRWDDDLLTIQRYPGKTNEQFTRLLVNLGAAAAGGSEAFTGRRRLRVLDPVCGRGTTLNHVVRCGWDAAGVDVDAGDIEAYATFFTTWLKDKRVKHEAARSRGRRPGSPRVELTVRFAASKEGLRSADRQEVRVVTGDAADLRSHFKARSFDAIVGDLPYGVQHGSRPAGDSGASHRSPAALLDAALPGWFEVVRPGGAVVLAWNRNVLDRPDLVARLTAAGFELPLAGLAVDFTHRVDRAVLRDVVVARRPFRADAPRPAT